MNANAPRETLLSAVLGRDRSLFAGEMDLHGPAIRDRIGDARVLVIGAAGSIGAAFVRVLAGHRLAALHLVDLSENGLVEVVRDLRSSGTPLPDDFATFAVDFGAPEFAELLTDRRYDYVLNFSALKHVRSERDRYTLMRMLRTNVLANEDLAGALRDRPPRTLFSVSSDKAVRPGNLMGASKAFMERVLLATADEVPFNSARFANVAFSAGSLLDGFGHRIAKRQPLSAPSDVRRFFISHEEAGQLCFLGCFLGGNREIFYPKLDADADMLSFADIARTVLRHRGYEPMESASEEEALRAAANMPADPTRWPCYFSGSDTAGEKPFEEFVDPRESTDETRYERCGVVTSPIDHGVEPVRQATNQIRTASARGHWTKSELADAVRTAVPELDHVESDRNLDQKM